MQHIRFLPVERGFYATSAFGSRWGGFHWGVDYGRDGGSGGYPIFSAQAGTVTAAGPASGFGRWINVDHPAAAGAGLTVYGHVIPEVHAGQHVRAGERIGRIDPDSRTNGGVAPHLHFEVHRSVWSPPGGDRLDPAIWLAGALWPGDTQKEDKPVTLFGIDVSNHQKNFDFAAAKREGFAFATHKVTESDDYRDPYWGRARDQMREHFPGTFGGYHFYRRSADVNRQADALAAHLGDLSIPVQLDFEDTAGGGTVEDMHAMIGAIEARGMRVFSNYVPKWFWESRMSSRPLIGSPPLWSSHYGANPTGFASAIYPGDTGAGWQSYGGVDVAIWQFGERGKVAGQLVDVNAFRGTEQQLIELFGGRSQKGAEMDFDSFKTYMDSVASDVKDIRQQLAGGRDAGEYHGWPQLGGRTLVDALAVVGAALNIEGFTDPRRTS